MPVRHLSMREVKLEAPLGQAPEAAALVAVRLAADEVIDGPPSALTLVTSVGDRARVWRIEGVAAVDLDDVVRTIAWREEAESVSLAQSCTSPFDAANRSSCRVVAEALAGQADVLVVRTGAAAPGASRLFTRLRYDTNRWLGVPPARRPEVRFEQGVGAVIFGATRPD